jgi:hypothetical protein
MKKEMIRLALVATIAVTASAQETKDTRIPTDEF